MSRKEVQQWMDRVNRRCSPPGKLSNIPYAMTHDEDRTRLGIRSFIEQVAQSECIASVENEHGLGLRWYDNKYTAAQVQGFKKDEQPIPGYGICEELVPAIAAVIYEAIFEGKKEGVWQAEELENPK